MENYEKVLFLLATSVFLTRASFIVIFFSITIKYQNSIFIKYIKKFEISLGRLIVGAMCVYFPKHELSSKRFLSYLLLTREELVFLDDVRWTKLESWDNFYPKEEGIHRIENKLGYYEKHEELAK